MGLGRGIEGHRLDLPGAADAPAPAPRRRGGRPGRPTPPSSSTPRSTATSKPNGWVPPASPTRRTAPPGSHRGGGAARACPRSPRSRARRSAARRGRRASTPGRRRGGRDPRRARRRARAATARGRGRRRGASVRRPGRRRSSWSANWPSPPAPMTSTRAPRQATGRRDGPRGRASSRRRRAGPHGPGRASRARRGGGAGGRASPPRSRRRPGSRAPRSARSAARAARRTRAHVAAAPAAVHDHRVADRQAVAPQRTAGLRAGGVDPAGDLVPERARQLDPRLDAVDDVEVGVADAGAARRGREPRCRSARGAGPRRAGAPRRRRAAGRRASSRVGARGAGAAGRPRRRGRDRLRQGARMAWSTSRSGSTGSMIDADDRRRGRRRWPPGAATLTFSPSATVSMPSTSTALRRSSLRSRNGSSCFADEVGLLLLGVGADGGDRDAGLAQPLVRRRRAPRSPSCPRRLAAPVQGRRAEEEQERRLLRDEAAQVEEVAVGGAQPDRGQRIADR